MGQFCATLVDMITKQDRYRGALLGLAAGDALGTTLEFTEPNSFEPISEIVGGGPFRLKPGQWTDDTSMALCLAASLIEQDGFSATDQIERYVRWWREGYMSSTGHCFDIGNATSSALARYSKTGDPYSGSTDPYSAGNGSIMRLAPVALFYGADLEEVVNYSAESSRTTHAARACLDACRYFGVLIALAANGVDKHALLSPYAGEYDLFEEEPLVAEIAKIAEGSFKHKNPPNIRGTGYVVQSLEAALWAFYHAEDFASGARLAVNLGEDADTTGAVYGQIAGAFFGASDIPQRWRDVLTMCDEIVKMADALM